VRCGHPSDRPGRIVPCDDACRHERDDRQRVLTVHHLDGDKAKSEAYLASPAACRLRRGDNIGAPYRFTKGHVPANKGLRRPGWGPGRMKETQFRKGERQGRAVKLYKPIGTERVSKDGYTERKINDGLPLQRALARRASARVGSRARSAPARPRVAFRTATSRTFASRTSSSSRARADAPQHRPQPPRAAAADDPAARRPQTEDQPESPNQ
jgi:hypothetical protein